MGIAVSARGALFSLAALAASALAQQEGGAVRSPYSLGLGVDRAPFASSCPSTLLYCGGTQGLNLSVIGRAHFAAFDVFGKVGATSYARNDTSAMGAAPGTEPSGGLSWGGGVSWEFTPRLSATFEWISYDLRMPAGPVRTTSLGLKYRY